MKIGMQVPNYARWFRGDGIWATLEKGKELDLDALCFVDHVIITPRQYVGMGNGYMDEWTAMSYVAAINNVQKWHPILTHQVVVIPYRPPIQQAKIAATVDSLSGGKLLVGAGSGYQEYEFTALGLDIKQRGDMTDEYLACMKELWTNPVSSFHGKYVNYDEMTISVRPAQQPYPPVLYGSHGARPRRRIAERYQGNLQNPGRTVESQRAFDSDMEDLNRLWKENGRSGKPYQMAVTMAHLTTDRSQIGTEVLKGVMADGARPEGSTQLPGSTGRMEDGVERPYVSRYPMMHVDEMVENLRRLESLGTDLAIVWLPSYRHGEFDNLGMQLNQMQLLAEHVLPKVNRDKNIIEMDFDGKRHPVLTEP